MPTGHWTHLAITYQQNSATTGTAAIWVDGNLDMKQTIYGLTTGLINQSTAAMRLGQNDSGGNQVSGSIDNFRISNNARVFAPAVPYASITGNLCPNGDFEAGLVGFRMYGDGDTSLIWSTTTTNVKCGSAVRAIHDEQWHGPALAADSREPGPNLHVQRLVSGRHQLPLPGHSVDERLQYVGNRPLFHFPTRWAPRGASSRILLHGSRDGHYLRVPEPAMASPPGQISIDDVRFQAASSIQPKTLPDMITVGPATVPLGNFYTYTSGSTTATTLNIVNSDTASHTFTVSAVVTDAEGVAGTPVTVGHYTLSAGTRHDGHLSTPKRPARMLFAGLQHCRFGRHELDSACAVQVRRGTRPDRRGNRGDFHFRHERAPRYRAGRPRHQQHGDVGQVRRQISPYLVGLGHVRESARNLHLDRIRSAIQRRERRRHEAHGERATLHVEYGILLDGSHSLGRLVVVHVHQRAGRMGNVRGQDCPALRRQHRQLRALERADDGPSHDP